MHPSHHPFHTEAKAPAIHGPTHARPGGGLFRDGLHIREIPIYSLIQFLQETDGLQIFAATVLIGYPFSFLAGIVEVKHGSHRVYPQPIYMVPIQPKYGIADQKRTHLIATVVENIRAPIGMKSLPWILMLI